MNTKSNKIFLGIMVFIVSQLPSHAYLDPGTGSLVIQILIAAFAGIACWVKLQWLNIKSFFKKLSLKKSDNENVNISHLTTDNKTPEEKILNV